MLPILGPASCHVNFWFGDVTTPANASASSQTRLNDNASRGTYVLTKFTPSFVLNFKTSKSFSKVLKSVGSVWDPPAGDNAWRPGAQLAHSVPVPMCPIACPIFLKSFWNDEYTMIRANDGTELGTETDGQARPSEFKSVDNYCKHYCTDAQSGTKTRPAPLFGSISSSQLSAFIIWYTTFANCPQIAPE